MYCRSVVPVFSQGVMSLRPETAVICPINLDFSVTRFYQQKKYAYPLVDKNKSH